MTSKATRRFWKLHDELPEAIQRLAVKNYRLGATIPVIRRLTSRNLAGVPNAFPFALGIIIAHWDIRSATALNGFGLARTRNTTSLWDNPLIDFTRVCGDDVSS